MGRLGRYRGCRLGQLLDSQPQGVVGAGRDASGHCSRPRAIGLGQSIGKGLTGECITCDGIQTGEDTIACLRAAKFRGFVRFVAVKLDVPTDA